MAVKYARTVGGNWSTDASWSTTSGGAADTTKPVAGDTANLDANSGQITVDVASACTIVNCTGYTNTLTFNAALTVAGTVTFVSGMTITGTSDLIVTTTATLTSGGKTLTGGLHFQGTATFTLADNWDVNGTLTVGGGAGTTTINGNTINAGGNLTQGVRNSLGTTNIIMDGTGTWSSTASIGIAIRHNLTFNTAGTITISGNVRYSVNSLVYTAGTMITTGSDLSTEIASDTLIFNTSGMTWNNISLGSTGTITNTSTLNISGTLNLGQTSNTCTYNGSDFNVTGNFLSRNTTGSSGGTAKVVMAGTGSQTLTMNNTTGVQRLVFIIDSTGTVTFSTIAQTLNPIIYKRGLLAGNILGMPKTVFRTS